LSVAGIGLAKQRPEWIVGENKCKTLANSLVLYEV